MKKLFTDAHKWDKAWYRKLSPKLKCLWAYITERCDQAGVWEGDFELASFYIGEIVTQQDLAHFDGRVVKFGGKFRIVGYIYFQNGMLSPRCKAHIPIIKLVAKYGINPEYPTDEEVEPVEPVMQAEPVKSSKAIKISEPIFSVPKADPMEKDQVFEEMFSNERYMESIRKIAQGKDIKQAFEECWAYHSATPTPPDAVWIWKQKFITWLTIKKKDVTPKDKQRTRTEGLINSFNARLGDTPES